MRVLGVLSLAIAAAHGFVAPAAPFVPSSSVAARTTAPVHMNMFGGLFGGNKNDEAPSGGPMNARDADFARRQAKLQERQSKAATQPKGAVECTFPQKGNKVVMAKQGEPLGKVISRAGLRVKFDCKNGRCGTCQVRLNGRAAAKVCQGATVSNPHPTSELGSASIPKCFLFCRVLYSPGSACPLHRYPAVRQGSSRSRSTTTEDKSDSYAYF